MTPWNDNELRSLATYDEEKKRMARETMKILGCKTKKIEFRRKTEEKVIKRLYIAKNVYCKKEHYNIVCNYL